MKLVKFGPNLVICFEINGIRSKRPKFAENIPLATEPQPKLDPGYGILAKNRPLATEIGIKKGPVWAAQ